MRYNRLGSTGLVVSEVGLGTSPLGGGMAAAYGHAVPREVARVTARELLATAVTFVDTSNEYSDGESERLLGEAIAERGGLPEGVVLATKVDPIGGWQPREWTGARVRESVRESADRLGIDHFPLLYLHDPDRLPFEVMTAPGGPVETLRALRDEGVVDHVGLAMGDVDLAMRYLDLGGFDVVLNHNNYTLLDQGAEPLIAYAHRSGIAFVNAAPYASGVLARPRARTARYRYGEVDETTRRRVSELERICADVGVPLRVAALHFSLRDPRIASTIVGVSAPGRAERLVRDAETAMPPDLWEALGVGQPPA
ncbi:MAG: aldo/keto reductase [Arachnia sp.]